MNKQKWYYRNRAMEKIQCFGSFAKLMLFCLPIFIVIILTFILDMSGIPFPKWFSDTVTFISLWSMFCCWVWLFISFQIQWKKTTQNLLANISIPLIGVIWLILEFFF